MTAQAHNRPEDVAAFVALFQRHGTPALVANLETRLQVVQSGGLSFPLSLNDGAETCYICNPTSGYIDYALEETRHFARNPFLRAACMGLIRAARPFVKASGLDRQVQINNWLFSTNPVPALSVAQAVDLRDQLSSTFKTHAILLRSLNKLADAETIAALQTAGFDLLPARQVYIFSDISPDRPHSPNMRRDRLHLQRCPFPRVGNEDFTEEDYPVCAQLYADLYLRKYTPLNPDYTALYIQEMHRAGLLELAGFRDETGRLIAVTGLFASGRTLTQPIVGYDTSRPMREGLYRLIMQVARDHAAERGMFFNCSAGAAAFKRHRGGIPVIEYTAVYTRHLPRRQRWATALMRQLLTRIGVPLLQRFRL
ncbi:GNAT family N-acetyltransferase [Xinfangfangia sp. CPCC 101601]|uniref:GNAT family N-acetyltransferase n=1 Tax=Pseudogemmobacter lacusdianii TaxID=3069608 RepID=A0ABU0W431_9RHOB|nr:GNAT family N-acetyltransferase [Xinfangfangia sp. CPCC 101601]MDQ2067830.1 GNAT family N-acetyltransferase [Xinfangfangia sp. CPCC 101601]